MYHLPMRAQKRPAIRESTYFRRSIMPPGSYRTPSLQELMSPNTSERTPPFTPTSTLSTSRSPAISTPRTASYTFIPPSQDMRGGQKPSLESPLRQQPVIVGQDDDEQYSRQYVVEEKGPFATDLRLRDSRSRASALRKGRKASKVTFNLLRTSSFVCIPLCLLILSGRLIRDPLSGLDYFTVTIFYSLSLPQFSCIDSHHHVRYHHCMCIVLTPLNYLYYVFASCTTDALEMYPYTHFLFPFVLHSKLNNIRTLVM